MTTKSQRIGSFGIQETAVDQSPEYVEPLVDPHYLLLDCVQEHVQDETIRLYLTILLNPTLDAAFKIEQIRRNRRRCLVRVNLPLRLKDVTERQARVPDLAGTTVALSEVRTPDTVRISGLGNSSISKELINLYFSNQKISAGGDVRNIKVYEYDAKALVQFQDYRRVEAVLAKSHVLGESSLKLEKYYGAIEDEFLAEEEEQEAAGQPTKSNKTSFTVRAFSTPSLVVDRTKLVVSNVQENINIQQLDLFIQMLCGVHKTDINEINWSLEKRGKLIIDFRREVDINRVLSDFNNNASLTTLNGRPVQLETVNKTRTLVVLVKGQKKPQKKDEIGSDDYDPESIPATRDLIDLYLMNKQRSGGGGEIESIERRSARYWLVRLKDQRVMKDILSRKHVVDEKPIKMFPYYENFGLPYLFRPIFDEHTSQTAMSASFKMRLRDERIRPFAKVRGLHKRLNELLGEANASSRFNKSDTSILLVNYLEKLITKVPYSERIWRLRVVEAVEYFLRIYRLEKLTLTVSQWATITKTKQLNEAFFDALSSVDNEAVVGVGRKNGDDETKSETGSVYGTDVRHVSPNCAIISVVDSGAHVQIQIVGENGEVDRFIVKIKDIICKAYFTFELEEKIIKFKTYLSECEQLLAKWLSAAMEGEDDDEDYLDSAESLSSNRGPGGLKLNKSRRHTIDEFLSKLERDLLDMELSYGKLFQELGYNFLTRNSEEYGDEEESDYKEFNSKLSSSLDEHTPGSVTTTAKESQMDKIKHTLDGLNTRINTMRKKFRQYTIRMKRVGGRSGDVSSDGGGDDDDLDDEDVEDHIKLCVVIEEAGKIWTYKVNQSCRVRDLRTMLFNKLADPSIRSVDSLILMFNKAELANDNFTISDYGITDGSTVVLEIERL